MRILVLSDSHGAVHKLRDILLLHPEADQIIHLGDGARDPDRVMELIGGRPLTQVCGNCDFASPLPTRAFVRAGDALIYCCHGHVEQVKYGRAMLEDAARACGARIVLYGHTHEPVTEYKDGLYLMNPGAVFNGCYGMVDLTPGGILCHLAALH